MSLVSDFASVQWQRKTQAVLEPILKRSADDIGKIGTLLQFLAELKREEVEPTPEQMLVLLQYLHRKELVKLTPARRGNLNVEFRGGGYEYERFLLRPTGQMPNHKYESKKSS